MVPWIFQQYTTPPFSVVYSQKTEGVVQTRSDLQRKIAQACAHQDRAGVEALLQHFVFKTGDLSKAYLQCMGHAQSDIAQLLAATAPPSWSVLETLCLKTAQGCNAPMFDWTIEQMERLNKNETKDRSKRLQRACASASLVAVRAQKGCAAALKILQGALPHTPVALHPHLCLLAIQHHQKSAFSLLINHTNPTAVRHLLEQTPLPPAQKHWAEAALNKHQNLVLRQAVDQSTLQSTKRKM